MAPDKLLAEWFWIDRWVGSSAFGLPQEARGVYREMLTQAWRRGAQLPNDPDQIRRMTATTAGEWRRAWPKVKKFWRIDGDTLVNDTQLEIYAEAKARSERASKRGLSGAQARHKHSNGNAQAEPEHKPPVSVSGLQSPKEREQKKSGGSKRPIFSGNRFVAFEWMLDDLVRTLGAHSETFDLHAWFDALDQRAVADNLVITREECWPWLQAELTAEVKRRGLPMVTTSTRKPMLTDTLEEMTAVVRETLRKQGALTGD